MANPNPNPTPTLFESPPTPKPAPFESFLLALGHQLPNHQSSIGLHITKTPDGHTTYLPVDESHDINVLQLMLGNTTPLPADGSTEISHETWDQLPRLFGDYRRVSRMYVRPSYPMLFNVIMSHRRRVGYEEYKNQATIMTSSRGVVLIGNNGIGKTTFLGYFMWKLLHPPAGQPRPPIIFHNLKRHAGAEAWMIDGADAPIDGVLQFAPPITPANIHFAPGGQLTSPMKRTLDYERNSYYLVDCSPTPSKNELIYDLSLGFSVVTTVPLAMPSLKYWRRRAYPKILYCPVWSVDELLEARLICYGSREERIGTAIPHETALYRDASDNDARVRRLYQIHGGSIQKMIWSFDSIIDCKDEIEREIFSTDLIKLMSVARAHMSYITNDEVINGLFHYNVYVHDAITDEQYDQYNADMDNERPNQLKALPFELLKPRLKFASEFIEDNYQKLVSHRSEAKLADFMAESRYLSLRVVRDKVFESYVLRGLWSMSQSKSLWNQGGFAYKSSRQLMITLDPNDSTKVATITPELDEYDDEKIHPMPIKISHMYPYLRMIQTAGDIGALPHQWRLQGCDKNFPTISAVLTPYWAFKTTVTSNPSINVKELVDAITELKKFQVPLVSPENVIIRPAAPESKIKLVFVVPDKWAMSDFVLHPTNFIQDSTNPLPIPITEFEVWIMSFGDGCIDLPQYSRQAYEPPIPPCMCGPSGFSAVVGLSSTPSKSCPDRCACRLKNAYCDHECQCSDRSKVTCTNRDPWNF